MKNKWMWLAVAAGVLFYMMKKKPVAAPPMMSVHPDQAAINPFFSTV